MRFTHQFHFVYQICPMGPQCGAWNAPYISHLGRVRFTHRFHLNTIVHLSDSAARLVRCMECTLRQTARGDHAIEEDGSREPDDEIVEVAERSPGIVASGGGVGQVRPQDKLPGGGRRI